MKTVAAAALALLVLPLPALAQSQSRTDLEDALRQTQLICAGMMDIKARTGRGYNGHQLAQCLVNLEAQRSALQRFMGASTAAMR
jgi:hypothetical protein